MRIPRNALILFLAGTFLPTGRAQEAPRNPSPDFDGATRLFEEAKVRATVPGPSPSGPSPRT